MAIELVSFDDLDTYLDLAKEESGYPDLTLIQESVVAAIERHLNRELELDTRTETNFIYSATTMIPVKALPIVSITSVTIDGDTTTEYKKRSYGIQLDLCTDNSEVIVTYEGGIEDVPSAIKRAALLQTVYEYQNKDSIGIENVSTEGGSITKPELGLLKEVKMLLQKHKHPFIDF